MAVVWLLRAAWIAGILPILVVASFPLSRMRSLHDLLLKFAKRGKIFQSSSKKFSVPQKFFCHFYILAVIWTTFLLVVTWLFAYKIAPTVSEPLLDSGIAKHLTGVSRAFSLNESHLSSTELNDRVWKSVFLLLLMEAQVLRRLIESIYVFKYSPSARMHILGYLTGLFYYTAAPLSLCCTYASDIFELVASLFAEFIFKGKDRVQVEEFDLWGHINPLMQLKWYVWIGAAVFSWGWIHQLRCHLILGSLRKNGQRVSEYVIPYGDWFEYVSSPHYLAEIVIYSGLVIASGCSDITIWLLFGFVVANLTFAAVETHKWYLRKFENYPRTHFAIIPFVR